VLDSFASRLRDDVDVEVVRGDLLDAVIEAVDPQFASVWVR